MQSSVMLVPGLLTGRDTLAMQTSLLPPVYLPARIHCPGVHRGQVHQCSCPRRGASWQCVQRRTSARRSPGAGKELTSMITMTEWEDDVREVREGEAKNHKAQNLRELFKRADLDGCRQAAHTACCSLAATRVRPWCTAVVLMFLLPHRNGVIDRQELKALLQSTDNGFQAVTLVRTQARPRLHPHTTVALLCWPAHRGLRCK